MSSPRLFLFGSYRQSLVGDSRLFVRSAREVRLREILMMGDRRLVGYLAVLGVVGAVSFALPGSAGGAVRLLVGTVGVVSLVGAVVLRRPNRATGWWLIALSAVCAYSAAVAVAVADMLGHGRHLGSVLQFVLTGLALFLLAAGLAVLGWRTVGRRGWDALDAAITAIGAFLIVWVLYIDPALARSTSAFATLVATVVPAASLLVFAMAVKLAFGGAISTWSGRMLLLASAAALCTSAFVYFEPIGVGGRPSRPDRCRGVVGHVHIAWRSRHRGGLR